MTEWTRWSRVIALGDLTRLTQLAGDLVTALGGVRTLQEPATSLVMMEASDPVSGGSFYVGEVLVTSCVVDVGGRTGCAVVIGDEPERAWAGAVIRGALQHDDLPTALRAAVLEALAEEERAIELSRRAEWELVARTKVDFETMEDRDSGVRSGV